jgi:hypothetical protein
MTPEQQEADQRRTAKLIHELYLRLENVGVEGDGWAEGREMSRDGIINKETADGVEGLAVGREAGRKGKGKELVVREVDHELPINAEELLKKVDR